ncbi:MAG: hypothetical protein J6B87_03455 [Clostridia bacterium]|nr:hypothetical protein [Clostridia bacterium]
MKKICKILVIIAMLCTLVACKSNTEENKKANIKKEDVYVTGITDLVSGTKVNFKDNLEGISSDGKTFKLNDEVGEKTLEGFEGTVKSVTYIHDEILEKRGTLGILNTNGEVYISNGGLFADKVFLSKVNLDEKVKAISSTASHKSETGIILMLTESEKVKAIDENSMDAYDYVVEEESKLSEIYEVLVENGRMWSPVFTINPSTQEKVFFEEQVSVIMLNDNSDMMFEDRKTEEYKHGSYEVKVETREVEITYDDETKETYKIVDNLGDNEVYLVITNGEGLDVYYRQ